WACGTTTEKVRDVVQRKLFGDPGHMGTGFIPQADILDVQMSRGGGRVVDFAIIRHQAGGASFLSFKSYEQGLESFMGDDLDFAWCDEEPSSEIYQEIQARTTDRQGMIFTTFTPLNGITEIVNFFWPEPDSPQRHLTHMQIEDALHIPEERREEEIKKYPKHMRDARVRGIPFLGSGPVFPVAEESIIEPAPKLPDHWARIAGMDLGWDHPTAIAWGAWDRDADVIHIYDCHRESEAPISVHASAIRARGAWIPVAWPFDALRHEQGSATDVANLYRREGVNMLPGHSTFEGGGYGTEAGLQEMLNRMLTGRLKVAAHLEMWLQEFRQYHRKDGKLVKKRDDLMDATRQIVMMTRFAEANRQFVYPTQVGMDWDPLNPTAPSGGLPQVAGMRSEWRH
ncbi:MAG TPA: terminase family protein, partial [Candidatus Bathyarchaeia archaeon]|nr:terminase family protein [Candidatus Bathyarchaeia archaeon]